MSCFKRYRGSKADLQTLSQNSCGNGSASSSDTSSSESNENRDVDYSNQNCAMDLSDIAKST